MYGLPYYILEQYQKFPFVGLKIYEGFLKCYCTFVVTPPTNAMFLYFSNIYYDRPHIHKEVCSKNFKGNSFEYIKRKFQRRFLHLYCCSEPDRFQVLRPLPSTPPYPDISNLKLTNPIFSLKRQMNHFRKWPFWGV